MLKKNRQVKRKGEPARGEGDSLRQKAESRIPELTDEDLRNLSPDEVLRIVHELRVHQIELEIQNEELRRAQIELEESRTKYADLYDFAPAGYLTVDNNNIITQANLTMAVMLDLQRSQIIKSRLARYIFPSDHGLFYSKMKLLEKEGSSQIFQLRLLRSNSVTFWVQMEGRTAADSSGKIISRFSVSDITEHKASEKALLDSEEGFRLLFEEMISGLGLHEIILDDKGEPVDYRFLSVNRSFQTLTGLNARYIIGKTALEVLPETDKDVIRRYGRVALSGIPDQFELYSATVGRFFEVRAYSPGPKKFAVMFHDITARRRNEEYQKARLRIRDFSEQHGINEILQKTLDEAELLTNSQMGFAHFVSSDQNSLSLQAWSTRTSSELCTAPQEKKHYPVNMAGVWTECFHSRAPVIHNDYKSLSHRKGLPQGHPPLKRELVIPIIKDDVVVAIFGLGNKVAEYTDEDAALLSGLSNMTWDDIQRKTAEASLHKQVALTNSILNMTPSLFILKDINSVYLEVNEPFCKFLGRNREDIIGKTDFDLFPPDDAVSYVKSDQEVISTGLTKRDDTQVTGQEGVRWLHVIKTALLDDDGKCSGVLCSITDVSERKKIEEDLKISLGKYETLFNTFPLGITVSDASGAIVESNLTAERILGLKVTEQNSSSIDSNDWKIINPDGTPMQPEQFASVISLRENRLVENVEMGIVKPDGQVTWITVFAAPLHLSNYGVVVTYSDVTRRQQAEAELNRLNAELEQRITERTEKLSTLNEELEAFVYSVSHDLRAPLRAIDGFLKIISEDYGSQFGEEGTRLFTVVRDNAKKMDGLIINLLEMSRISRSEMVVSYQDMTALVKNCYNEIATGEMKKGIEFSVSTLLGAYCDSALMWQTWSNLISNAIKFTIKAKERKISIGSYREKEMNVYFIKDNGVGFNPQYIHKLFNTFQRLHQDREFEGTGIGLAIVKRIINRHGGKVWAESEDGKGATFYFTLPDKDPDNLTE